MEKTIPFNIIKQLGVLSEKKDGYTKQINLVSWNNHSPKLEIRIWSPEGMPGKGVTLTEEGGRKLLNALRDYYEELDSGQ